MAVTTEEILAAARELAGRAMMDGEEKILSVLCAGELGAWRGRLREGVTEEDCGDALTVACAWGALAAMETAWEHGSGRVVSIFRRGPLGAGNGRTDGGGESQRPAAAGGAADGPLCQRRGLCLLGGGGLRTTFGGYVRTVLAKYGVAISLWKDGRCLGEGLAVVRPVLDREWQWVPTERGVSRQEKGLCLAEAALPFDTEGPLVLQWEARCYDVVNARKLRAGEESICWQAALRRREEDAA